MYLNFYKLAHEPFSLTPDPDFFYLGPGHREAFASVCYGVERGKGFACVTGEVGTGKTTVVRTYLARRLGDHIVPVYLFHAKLTFRELLVTILRELDAGAVTETCGDMLNHLYNKLIAFHMERKVVALFIDEAQNLDVETLEGLRMLSNLETRKQKLLQIILIGQPELEDKLRRRELRQLNQRIAVRASIPPLTREESVAYILHRLRVAADMPAEVFTPAALRLIARKTRGIPRNLNILCDHTLVEGYAAQQRPATPRTVRAALRHETRRQWTRRGRLEVSAAGVVVLMSLLVALYPYRGTFLNTGEEGARAEAAVVATAPDPLPAPADSPEEPATEAPPGFSEPEAPATIAPMPGDPETETEAPDDRLLAIETMAPAPPARQKHTDISLPKLIDTLGALSVAIEGPVLPPEAAPAPSSQRMDQDGSWPVKVGDTLTEIARSAYGDATPEILHRIRRGNPQIRDADLIYPGDTIVLPAHQAIDHVPPGGDALNTGEGGAS